MSLSAFFDLTSVGDLPIAQKGEQYAHGDECIGFIKKVSFIVLGMRVFDKYLTRDNPFSNPFSVHVVTCTYSFQTLITDIETRGVINYVTCNTLKRSGLCEASASHLSGCKSGSQCKSASHAL